MSDYAELKEKAESGLLGAAGGALTVKRTTILSLIADLEAAEKKAKTEFDRGFSVSAELERTRDDLAVAEKVIEELFEALEGWNDSECACRDDDAPCVYCDTRAALAAYDDWKGADDA